MTNNINKYINQLPVHKNRRCIYCGRGYPDTILNIEGMIHHNAKISCMDTKTCNKIRKNNRGKH